VGLLSAAAKDTSSSPRRELRRNLKPSFICILDALYILWDNTPIVKNARPEIMIYHVVKRAD